MLKQLAKKRGKKTKLEKLEERGAESRSQWKMITVVQDHLRGFACVDLLLQVLVQMPLIYENPVETELGIRKIWIHPLADASTANSFSYTNVINMGHADTFEGLTMNM